MTNARKTQAQGVTMADTFDLARTTLAAAPVAIALCDPVRPGCPLLLVNPAFTHLTGYAAEDAVGRNLASLFEDDAGSAAVARACRERHQESLDLTLRRSDGSPLALRLDLVPVLEDGGAARRLVAVLHRSLGGLAEAIPVPIVVLAQDGGIVEANRMAGEILGLDTLAGRPLAEFFAEADDWAQFDDRLRQRGSLRHTELRARRGDGSELWLRLSAQAMASAHGRRVMVALDDVTTHRLREDALHREKEEAERSVRSKMRFFAAASHDLRQPLQALALFLSALEGQLQTRQGQTILQSMKTSLKTMEDMFDALLNMSRLDAGVLKASPTVVMINDLLEAIDSEFGPQAQAGGLRLKMVPSSEAVISDPQLLARILRNFVANAVRYTRSGKVLVGCRRRGRFLRIEVHDSGPGIPENQLQAIFDEFYQDRSSAEGKGGVGLGLAIVQRLARLLQHRLDVRSAPGRGSMFAVEVPRADVAPAAAGDAADDAADDDGPDLAGAVIVVVDDDRDILAGVRLLLEDWGCEAIVAADLDEAVATLEARRVTPDVIVADLHLPVPGGGTAVIAALLRRLPAPVPAFVFTGDTALLTAQSPDGGPIQVLHKPVEAGRLRTVLAAALGRG